LRERRYRRHVSARRSRAALRRSALERAEPDPESLGIGTVLGATRKLDAAAVEALEALSEHWAVDLPAKAGCDMDDPAWIDSQALRS
jgi:hypothetical protein